MILNFKRSSVSFEGNRSTDRLRAVTVCYRPLHREEGPQVNCAASRQITPANEAISEAGSSSLPSPAARLQISVFRFAPIASFAWALSWGLEVVDAKVEGASGPAPRPSSWSNEPAIGHEREVAPGSSKGLALAI